MNWKRPDISVMTRGIFVLSIFDHGNHIPRWSWGLSLKSGEELTSSKKCGHVALTLEEAAEGVEGAYRHYSGADRDETGGDHG